MTHMLTILLDRLPHHQLMTPTVAELTLVKYATEKNWRMNASDLSSVHSKTTLASVLPLNISNKKGRNVLRTRFIFR